MGLWDNLTAPFSAQPAQNAADAQSAGLRQGYGLANPLLQAGAANIQQYGNAALAPLNQNYAMANQGQNALASLLGFGPQGSAGVQSALENTPGYQFTRNQGIQNTDRNQAAMGALNSGATDKAIADYTTGLADKTYQSAVGNLQPYLGYAQGTAGQIANTNMGIGSALAGNLGQQAGLAYGTEAGIGNANANAAMAPVTAGENLWGLGTNLARGLASPMPSGGQGTIGGSLYGAGRSLFGNIFGGGGIGPQNSGMTGFGQTQGNPNTWIPAPYGQ